MIEVPRLRIKGVNFFILVKICSIYGRLAQRVIPNQSASSGPLATPQVFLGGVTRKGVFRAALSTLIT